ncbi:MAG: aminotransferase class V-fold PLP-dependent enzyme [Bacteriovorax sp.]|nr:aminotransferase class V-fold PLP-dependent enzyme [Bacteriovorax sp.]
MDSATRSLIKKEFSELSSIYFNAAYFGPSPLRSKDTILEAMKRELDPSFYAYDDWMSISEKLRVKFASLLNVSPDTITHSTSSSDVINIVANGFIFSKGDRVAAIDKDYPSNILPWMLAERHGKFTFDKLSLGSAVVPTPEWLEENLKPQTRIFNVSYVTFDTGKKLDLLSLGKYLKSKNIMFVVDATQALGGLDISPEVLSYIDVLTCSSYKWMLGPYGHAFAYFSQKAQDQIYHLNANWILSPNSKQVYNLLDYTTETLPGARQYDRGQAANLLCSGCLEGSLNFLLEVGLSNIKRHNESVRDYFLAHYPRQKYSLITPMEYMGNIVCLKGSNADSIALEAELKKRNVDVSVRQGNIRLSFHIFNTNEQVDELIKALDSQK